MADRNGVLEMFVLYIDDSVVSGKCPAGLAKSNERVILTCSTYLVFDNRSITQRSKCDIEEVLAELKEQTYENFNKQIDKLAESGARLKLECIYDLLCDNPCRQRLKRILETGKTDVGPKKKIEI